jgi:hypothetical protein
MVDEEDPIASVELPLPIEDDEEALKQLAKSLAKASSPEEEVKRSMDSCRSIALGAVNVLPSKKELPLAA